MKRLVFVLLVVAVAEARSQTPIISISVLDTNIQFPLIPALSGRTVAFDDYRAFNYSLHTVNIDTKLEQFRTHTGFTEPQVRISGDRVVYVGYPTATQGDVYVFDLSSNLTVRLTDDTAFQNFPDIQGSRVVWQDYRNTATSNPKNADIYMYDFTSGTTKQITTDTAYQSFPAVWGNRIVWQDYRNAGTDTLNADIYMYDVSTDQEFQITSNTAYQTFPAIWEDKIVWEDFRNGTGDIYMYDLSTHTERPISTFPAYKTHPAIYRDWIVWQDYRNGTSQADLYGFNLITNQEYPIVVQPDHQDYPQLDSNVVVWQDFRNSRQDLYMAEITWPPAVSLTSPNGGETWTAGTMRAITWSALGITALKIDYSTDNGSTWGIVTASAPASAGSYAWSVPNTPTSQALVRISDSANPGVSDLSNAAFTIVAPSVTLTSPNGGEVWEVGTSHNITWTSANVDHVQLSYSTNNGGSWQTIVASTAASAGSYPWVVPNTQTASALVRVTDAEAPGFNDASNGVFTISAPPTVTLLAPNGGEVWHVGTQQTISWTPTSVALLRCEYTTDNGSSWSVVADSLPPAQTSLLWWVPNTQTTQALVRISDDGNPSTSDVSDAPFSIASSETVGVSLGWNMLSVPLLLGDYRKTAVYPSSISPAFTYVGAYQVRDTLRNGVGYWVKYGSPQDVQYAGQSVARETIDVQDTWNMVGSISTPVPVSTITSIPGGMITSLFFGSSVSGYAVADTIVPGRGYWVKVNQSGQLVLASSPAAVSAEKIQILPGDELPPFPPEADGAIAPMATPTEFAVDQNYPNPFNPVTSISYALPVRGYVRLVVFDMLGRIVGTLVDGIQEAGNKSVVWDASAFASGLYLYRLDAVSSADPGTSFTQVRKMLLVR